MTKPIPKPASTLPRLPLRIGKWPFMLLQRLADDGATRTGQLKWRMNAVDGAGQASFYAAIRDLSHAGLVEKVVREGEYYWCLTTQGLEKLEQQELLTQARAAAESSKKVRIRSPKVCDTPATTLQQVVAAWKPNGA